MISNRRQVIKIKDQVLTSPMEATEAVKNAMGSSDSEPDT